VGITSLHTASRNPWKNYKKDKKLKGDKISIVANVKKSLLELLCVPWLI